MNLLAVETSTELCSVALLRGTDVIGEESLAGNRHSELLAPMIRRVLGEAGLPVRALDGFAFGQGPGAFTGIRIACGIVQGMAFAAGRRVLGVPSLLALAEECGARRVLAALDARMGEAYFAAYARDGEDWEEIVAPCLVAAAGKPPVEGGGWTAVGSGFDRHDWLRAAWPGQVERRIEGRLPRAEAVARVARRRFDRDAVAAEHAAPLYLRDKVALTTEERRAIP